MRRSLLCLLTVSAALISAPAAHGSGWVTSEPLSPANRFAGEVQLTLLPDGGRAVAWVQTGADAQTIENVSVRIAPPHGDFGPAQVFPTASAGNLRLASGADGTVVVSWTEFPARDLHIARRAPGEATFTQVTPLRAIGNESPSSTTLAVVNGDVFLSYSSFDGGPRTSSVWAARLPAGAATAQLLTGGALERATDPDFVQFPSIGVEDGRVSVAWERNSPRQPPAVSTSILRLAAGPAGGGLGAPITLDTQASNSTFAPTLNARVATGGGRTYVVWEQEVTRHLAVEDLANPGRILPFGGDQLSFRFDAAVDGSGSLVAAWEGFIPDNSERTVSVGRVLPDGAPLTPVRLATANVSRTLDDLAIAPDGNALALVRHGSDSSSTTFQFDAALAPPRGAFGPLEGVTGLQDGGRNRFFRAQAAVAPGGRSLIAWTGSDHAGTFNDRLFVSERDVTAPTLASITTPATATVGQPVELAATATDDLSQPRISWDLGDGSEADGARTSHVYGRAGAATVTVTATDSVGNVTRETRVIAVAAASHPGAGGPGAGPGTLDRVKPVVTALSVTNRRFRVGSKATAQIAGRRRTPVGTTLRFALSERSTVVVAITSKAKRKTVVNGTFVRARTAPGRASIAFSGRLGRTTLKPGSYTASVTAIDGAGNRSSVARVKFSVVKK